MTVAAAITIMVMFVVLIFMVGVAIRKLSDIEWGQEMLMRRVLRIQERLDGYDRSRYDRSRWGR